MKAVLAFLFVAALSAGVTLTFAAMDVSFWPVIALIAVAGLALARIETPENVLAPLALAYGTGFTLVFMASQRASINPNAVAARQVSTVALAATAAVSLIALLLVEPKARRALAWLVPAVGLALIVAWLSGDHGSADPMRAYLLQWMSPLAAEVVLTIIRKTVHVGFYGVMAWLVYRGGEGGKNGPWPAIVFSMAHGVFDEYRQSLVPSRYGTPWDLLFDLAGILLFLRWAGAFAAKSKGYSSAR